jgi:hypothetical protein
MNAEGSAVRSAVIADPEAVSVQRASARRHQPSVVTTASPATGSGRSSWIVDSWLYDGPLSGSPDPDRTGSDIRCLAQ